MKVLFIGGTGIISSASTKLAAEQGIELTLLRRGQHAADLPANVSTLVADGSDEAAVRQALGKESFDAVVDWVAFTPSDIERDIRAGKLDAHAEEALAAHRAGSSRDL